MLNYAILAERKKGLLFILHIYASKNILVISSRFIFPVKGITVILPSAWDRRLVHGRQMPSKDVLYGFRQQARGNLL